MTNSTGFPRLAEYIHRARTLPEAWSVAGRSPRRLDVLASFTAEMLGPQIVVESDALVPLVPRFAPFGQFESIVTGPRAAELMAEPPDLFWLALRLEDVDGELVHSYVELGPNETARRLTAIVRRIADLARAAVRIAPALVSNLALPYAAAPHLFDAGDPDGMVFLLADANRTLARELSTVAGATVFDYAGAVADAGAEGWRDSRLHHVARAPCGPRQQAMLARRLARSAAAVSRPAAKCIVLDLDETLWGGVLGDDGISGIALGDDHPGSAYKEFQSSLLGYRRRGFLLAVASKNDEGLVREMLERHPEQLIRSDHLSYIAANWQPKPDNLRRIASALDIGLDALVFVDDNPAERAAVRAALPMVTVVDLPADPFDYVGALRGVAVLDRPVVLAEDRDRARLYQDDTRRRAFLDGATTAGDPLASLGMVATVGLADATTLNRVHQLLHKTNQFNLTTRRHDMTALQQLAEGEASRVAWLRLRDAFGDAGLVAVGILRRLDGDAWEIDSFLMSCRVMGRKVELALLAYLAELAGAAGSAQLIARYRSSARNHIVRGLYPECGFEEVDRAVDGSEVVYRAPLDGLPRWPSIIGRDQAP